MKLTALIMLLSSLLSAGTIAPNRLNNIYTNCAYVISRVGDEVVAEDEAGEKWCFIVDEDAEWEEDDYCTLIVDDNETEQIYDDSIVAVIPHTCKMYD